MGALAATVLLTGCFDGPSAPANEADTNQLAVAAATVVKRVNVTFFVSKRTNNPRNDGMSTAIRRCRTALPNARRFDLVRATTGSSRSMLWNQVWTCTSITTR